MAAAKGSSRSAMSILWSLHRWIGIVFALILVVVSFSGALLVLNEDLERWTHPERRIYTPQAGIPPAEVTDILLALEDHAPPGFRPLRLEPALASDGADKYVFVGADPSERWSAFVNPQTGAILWSGHDQLNLRPWLLHLHEKLHWGASGFVIVGLSALALTILSFSGLWMTRHRLWQIVRHPIRTALGKRLLFSSIHQSLGWLSLYFTLVLGLTGLWFAWLIVPPLFTSQPRTLAPEVPVRQFPAINPLIEDALGRFNGSEIARVIFPWDDGINIQVRLLHRDAPVWEKFSRVEYDRTTGDLLKIRDARDASAGQKFESILGPLHFGYYGSSLTKWLYVFGGLTPGLLAVSGLAIWFYRRKRAVVPAASPVHA